MIKAKVYYQYQASGNVKVWIHVGQTNHLYTVVSGPTEYVQKDFLRLYDELNELQWEELDRPKIAMRD